MGTRTEMAVDTACNEIDAALFSGDYMESRDNRKTLTEWLDRWQRALTEHREAEITAAQDDIQKRQREIDSLYRTLNRKD